jgi:hypothetical protein
MKTWNLLLSRRYNLLFLYQIIFKVFNSHPNNCWYKNFKMVMKNIFSKILQVFYFNSNQRQKLFSFWHFAVSVDESFMLLVNVWNEKKKKLLLFCKKKKVFATTLWSTYPGPNQTPTRACPKPAHCIHSSMKTIHSKFFQMITVIISWKININCEKTEWKFSIFQTKKIILLINNWKLINFFSFQTFTNNMKENNCLTIVISCRWNNMLFFWKTAEPKINFCSSFMFNKKNMYHQNTGYFGGIRMGKTIFFLENLDFHRLTFSLENVHPFV